VEDKSKLHLWSLGTAIVYCSIGAFLALTYLTNLKEEHSPLLKAIFFPSMLITFNTSDEKESAISPILWHFILLLITWALFYLVIKMIKILWEMR
jgi:hypothetical protein